MQKILSLLSRTSFQLVISLILTTMIISGVILCGAEYVIDDISKSAYLQFVSGLASILALFCSVSFGLSLFVLQTNRRERLDSYHRLQNTLRNFWGWLISQPRNGNVDICLNLVFALTKFHLSDLPQRGYGDEYKAYTDALGAGLENDDREFWLQTSSYASYIEELLSEIGVVAIKQIITSVYLEILYKGLLLLGLLVITLVISFMWFASYAKMLLVGVAILCSIMVLLFFVQFARQVNRYYNEELEFVKSEK